MPMGFSGDSGELTSVKLEFELELREDEDEDEDDELRVGAGVGLLFDLLRPKILKTMLCPFKFDRIGPLI